MSITIIKFESYPKIFYFLLPGHWKTAYYRDLQVKMVFFVNMWGDFFSK